MSVVVPIAVPIFVSVPAAAVRPVPVGRTGLPWRSWWRSWFWLTRGHVVLRMGGPGRMFTVPLVVVCMTDSSAKLGIHVSDKIVSSTGTSTQAWNFSEKIYWYEWPGITFCRSLFRTNNLIDWAAHGHIGSCPEWGLIPTEPLGWIDWCAGKLHHDLSERTNTQLGISRQVGIHCSQNINQRLNPQKTPHNWCYG